MPSHGAHVSEKTVQNRAVEVRFRSVRHSLLVEDEGVAAFLEEPGERSALQDPLAGPNPHIVPSSARAVHEEPTPDLDHHDEGVRAAWTWEAFLLYAWKGKNPVLDAEKAQLLAKQPQPA